MSGLASPKGFVARAGLLATLPLAQMWAQAAPTGDEILRKVSDVYRAPRRCLFSFIATQLGADGREAGVRVEATMASEMPDKLRLDGLSPSSFGVTDMGDGPVALILDGRDAWLYVREANQYLQVPRASAPGTRQDLENGPEPALDRPEQMTAYMMGVFLQRYADYFASAKLIGTEKLTVKGRDVDCYVVETGPQRGRARYTWWVDQKRYFIWREDLAFRPSDFRQSDGSKSGDTSWRTSSSSRFTEIILNEPLPKGTFSFVPPANSERLTLGPK